MKIQTDLKAGGVADTAAYALDTATAALSTVGAQAVNTVKTASAQATRLAYLPGTIWNTVTAKLF